MIIYFVFPIKAKRKLDLESRFSSAIANNSAQAILQQTPTYQGNYKVTNIPYSCRFICMHYSLFFDTNFCTNALLILGVSSLAE